VPLLHGGGPEVDAQAFRAASQHALQELSMLRGLLLPMAMRSPTSVLMQADSYVPEAAMQAAATAPGE
jgi:hypothetical protein